MNDAREYGASVILGGEMMMMGGYRWVENQDVFIQCSIDNIKS